MVATIESPEAAGAPSNAANILLIDDDQKFSRLISAYLELHGFAVTPAYDGFSGIGRVATSDWQLVIIDVMLPDMSGFEVLQKIRAISTYPILMLTARGDEVDRIAGLEIGADDYVPKTYSSRELLARINAQIRRSRREGQQIEEQRMIEVGDLRISPESRQVFLGRQEIMLTPVEFSILINLARCKGKAKTREQLLAEVRDRSFNFQDRSIDVHISLLRKKLSDADSRGSRYIRTIRNVGYLLVDAQTTFVS